MNPILKKWGKVGTDRCSFCDSTGETYLHFFWECVKTQACWSFLKDYLREHDHTGFSLEVSFTPVNIVLGTLHPKPGHIANFLVLIVKQYLFRCRCSGVKPYAKQIEYEIDIMYEIENFIARSKWLYTRHSEKWSPIRIVPDLYTNIVSNS